MQKYTVGLLNPSKSLCFFSVKYGTQDHLAQHSAVQSLRSVGVGCLRVPGWAVSVSQGDRARSCGDHMSHPWIRNANPRAHLDLSLGSSKGLIKTALFPGGGGGVSIAS